MYTETPLKKNFVKSSICSMFSFLHFPPIINLHFFPPGARAVGSFLYYGEAIVSGALLPPPPPPPLLLLLLLLLRSGIFPLLFPLVPFLGQAPPSFARNELKPPQEKKECCDLVLLLLRTSAAAVNFSTLQKCRNDGSRKNGEKDRKNSASQEKGGEIQHGGDGENHFRFSFLPSN